MVNQIWPPPGRAAPGFVCTRVRLSCRAVLEGGGARRFVVCVVPQCVPLRAAACAGPSRSCDDYAPREPDHREMTQAYFDAKYAGEDGDWAGIAYRLSLHQG